MPRYPAGSVENDASGVAVAEILVGKDGHMERVSVLQAPDARIRKEVRDVLLKWEFKRTILDEFPDGLALRSKLIFYFEIENGAGHVRNPGEIQDRRLDVLEVAAAGAASVGRMNEKRSVSSSAVMRQ